MSAIAGILGYPFAETVCDAMLETMARRGTGEKAIYQKDDIVLLCIGDDAAQMQPPVWELGPERYVICCDGELYNREELKRELLALGHSFCGESDAEVLVHAYAQWKEQTPEKCNGIFALAVLEEKAGRVFLARDRIGVKPLFYIQQGMRLLFSSEIKTLLTHPSVQAELDGEGIGQLLLLGPGRTPGSGVFRGIRELEPGCRGVFEKGKLSVQRYWKLRDRVHTDSFEDTAQTVRQLVLDAIKRQLTPEIPTGTFLSGGLDSSLISAVCARELSAQGKRLESFSVDYADNEKYFRPGLFQPNSDPEYIRTMVDFLESRHHWTVLSPEELAAAVTEAAAARDLPGMADVDISLLLFCRQVSPHVSVAFSGECADEIFGGYPWYRDPEIRAFDGFPWARTTLERKNFLPQWLRQSLDPREFVQERYRQTLAECDILPENDGTDRRIKELVNLNFRWFMQTLLDRNDRMSAAAGLKVRVPLCDHRIAEYLYAVPWEMKEYAGREKGLLRYAMRDYLPDKVLYRKKSPFPKTHHPRYLALVSGMLRQLLEDKNAPIFQIVSKQALEALLEQDFSWPWYGQLMRRPQTIVYMLQINFWLERYSVRIV